MRQYHLTLGLLASAALTACGGSGTPGPVVSVSTARGTLAANPPNLVPIPQASGPAVPQLSPTAFAAMLEAGQPGITQVTGVPKCAISTYYMKYATVGGAGETTSSTGAIMVPSGTDAACSGPRPVLIYAHGTTANKAFNMANLRDNSEASLVAAMYAAQGFIVVASNYAGYDVSPLPYHPFLNATQQANDVIDSLRAARQAFPNISVQDSGKLFITGYSQGGFVAMATQREMQKNYASEFTVTAMAGQSGPYAMSLLADAIFAGAPNAGGTVFLPLITTSWQKSYANLYGSASEIYEDPYAATIETVLPGNYPSITDVYTAGVLPATHMFAANSGPVTPGFASFFGTGNLIKSSYRASFLGDVVQNPCNSSAEPSLQVACTPATQVRARALQNDLRTYVPTVPVMMCGGSSDPTVFFKSTTATAAFFVKNGYPMGYPVAATAGLQVLDVDSAILGASDPYAAAKGGFALAKNAVITAAVKANQDPVAAVAGVYHGSLVAPFCNAAARGFFLQVLASSH